MLDIMVSLRGVFTLYGSSKNTSDSLATCSGEYIVCSVESFKIFIFVFTCIFWKIPESTNVFHSVCGCSDVHRNSMKKSFCLTGPGIFT